MTTSYYLNQRVGHTLAPVSVGARIWALIAQDEDIQVNELCDLLMDEFDVERNTCEREVLEFLSQLRAHGLINAT